ncbi:SWI/SNF-related matrix-associated actin-dependent regulator of chromatin subfamily E member 1-related-like isoform X3 [Mustelus asterias]
MSVEMERDSEEMERGGGGCPPPALARTQFTLSPFAALQLSRKAATAVRANPTSCCASRGGRSGAAVTAYSGHSASRESAPFMESVPVTVSLENLDGQHRIVCVTTDANGGTLSYVGQLNSDVNLELQAAVSPQSLLQRDGALSAGNPLLQIHPLDAGSQRLQNVILEGQGEGSSGTKEVENDEPKKRKGGWPKGKKRKPPKDFAAPRAPTTGYVLFLNEQRAKLKIEHPDLPFTEITKLLGTQWSQLSQEGKQKYIDEAEKDKRRYIEELKAYQNSEAYQAFLKRRAMNKVKNLCGDFEKESAELSKQEQQQGNEDSADDADSAELSQLCGLTSKHNYTSLNLSLLEEYIFKQVKLRELELGELAKSLEHAQEEHENLNKQLEGFKNQKVKLETDLANLRAYGASLESQLESLRMVPMLFQFHIQIMDNGNCIRQKQFVSLDTLMK